MISLARHAWLVVALSLLASPARVVAQGWVPVGELQGFFALEPDADPIRYGGGAILDLQAPFGEGVFSGGMMLGFGALSSAAEAEGQSGLFLPLGASIALDLARESPVGFLVRARGGLWVDVDNAGIGAGGWAGGGVAMTIGVDPRLRFTVGADAWGVFEGSGEVRAFVTPAIGLRWYPPTVDDDAWEDDYDPLGDDDYDPLGDDDYDPLGEDEPASEPEPTEAPPTTDPEAAPPPEPVNSAESS